MDQRAARTDTVVFDLGNVFTTWDRALLYRSVFEDPEELHHFLNHVYTLDANDRLDLGQPLAEFCSQLADEHPRYADQILLLVARWIDTIGGVLQETVAVFDELRAAGVPCYALSNWNGETFARWCAAAFSPDRRSSVRPSCPVVSYC